VATKLAVALAVLVRPHARFAIPLSDAELFTDNPPMRDYLRRDPCRLHDATGRFLYVSRGLDRSLARSRPGCLTMPTTLVLASRDRIVHNARTSAACERLAGARLRTVELPGCHTLEFEPDRRGLDAALLESLRA
jgi:alpha-beta hydrolase superfamily lysophospholipase